MEYEKNVYKRKDIQLLSLLSFMYKSRIVENLNCKTTSITLRSDSKIKFRETLTHKTTVQKSPYYRGIALWNSLTPSLQKENTLLKFKQKIKAFSPNSYGQTVHIRKTRKKDIT